MTECCGGVSLDNPDMKETALAMGGVPYMIKNCIQDPTVIGVELNVIIVVVRMKDIVYQHNRVDFVIIQKRIVILGMGLLHRVEQ